MVLGARVSRSLVPHPQSCAGSRGSGRSLGRDGNGVRLRPESEPLGGVQVPGGSSGSSLTLVQSAPLAQKQGKNENWKERKTDKESTLLSFVNMSRNCFNIFTVSVLKEMCNNITVTDTQAL